MSAIFSANNLMLLAYTIAMIGLGFGSYYMYKLYRIKARPFWDHFHTGASFYGTMLTFGALFLTLFSTKIDSLIILTSLAIAGILLESIGIYSHKNQKDSGEAQASHFEQQTTFGKTYIFRNSLIIFNLALLVLAINTQSYLLVYLSIPTIIISGYLGRIMFYALVIPTTMPGAFFWKNEQFQEHAIEVGLDDMPQVGVMAPRHHKFDVKALLKVIKNTTMKDAFGQFKRVFTG